MCIKCLMEDYGARNSLTDESMPVARGHSGFAISACCGSGCPGCPTFPGNQQKQKEEEGLES